MRSRATNQQQIEKEQATLNNIALGRVSENGYALAKQVATAWCEHPAQLTKEAILPVPPYPSIFKAFVDVGEQYAPLPEFIAIYIAKCVTPLLEGRWGKLEGKHANCVAASLFRQRHPLAMRYVDSVSTCVSLPAILRQGASIDDVVYCVTSSPYCVAGAKLAIESAVEGQTHLVCYFRGLAIERPTILEKAVEEWTIQVSANVRTLSLVIPETGKIVKFLAEVCTTRHVQDAVLRRIGWPWRITDDTATYLINTRGVRQVSTLLLIDRLIISPIDSALALEIAVELMSFDRFPEWSHRVSVIDRVADVFFAQKTFPLGAEDIAKIHTSFHVVRMFAYAPDEKAQQYLGGLVERLKDDVRDASVATRLSTVASVLRYHRGDWARDCLLELARCDSSEVRQAAMDSLQEWGRDPEVQKVLTTNGL